MPTDAHPDGLRCPSCRSTNVVCHGRPHGHECQDCGYDGTTTDQLAQALALLRSHADVCSRYGEPDRLRAEADRIESGAAGPQATPDQVLWEGDIWQMPEGWRMPTAAPGTRVQVVAASEQEP